MAVAGLPPALPPGPLPLPVPLAQGVPLASFPPHQALQQSAYPGFFPPAYQPQPQPLRQPGQSGPGPWGTFSKPQRQATGTPKLKNLRRQNRSKTLQAAAAGGFVNGSTRPCQRLPARNVRQQTGAGPGLQQHAFKRPRHFPPPPRRNYRQGKSHKKRKQAPPPRAQTPWTIQHTPTTVQRTPSVVQGTPAAARPEGLSAWSPPHDHEVLLRPDGPATRRRRLSDGPFGSGLDYFGTNQGLILRSDVTSSSSAGSEADDSNSDSEPAQNCELQLASTAAASLPQHVQAHIDDQADHIAQLEVDNAKLADENINLKERMFVMEKEMAELRHAGAATTEEDIPPYGWFGMAESDFADDDDPHRVAAVADAPEPSPATMPASAQSSPATARNANATIESHTPVMIDVP